MTAASLIDKRLSLYGWKGGSRRPLLRLAQQLPPFFVGACGKFPPLTRTRAPIKQGRRGSSVAVPVNVDFPFLWSSPVLLYMAMDKRFAFDGIHSEQKNLSNSVSGVLEPEKFALSRSQIA